KSVSLDDIKVRTNLNETVFFFPDLKTDKDGNLLIRFTMNEALTRWKFLGLAHTQDLKIGQTRREIVTQKELMVVPNAPRFFREGDQVEFTAKVNNMTESMMNGTARLELFDAISMRPIDVALQNTTPTLAFTAEAG
ncbi:MAG: alpha-2-macroglobulin family protein, partial [Bacteroidota bacterium]